MKILFITAFPPCQKTAGQDYSRRLILDLLEKGHEVTLIYAEYPGHTVELPDSVKVLSIIHPAFKNCLVKPYFHPFFTRRFDKSVLKLLQTVSADFDMLYFDFSGKDVVKNRFCFYGAWNRAENTEALEWFLKNVYSQLSSDLDFVIIGGGMSEDLQRKLLHKKILA
mgnify:CR=1 FL=1